MTKIIKPIKKINGNLVLPGDEFASHLSLVLASLSQGESTIHNLSPSKNCQITTQCLKKLGVDIRIDSNKANVWGKGLKGVVPPKEGINFGDSEITFYLLAGILSGLENESQLKGDPSLVEKFERELSPSLEKMGIEVSFSKRKDALISLKNRGLKTLNFHLNESSSLAKTGLMIASLFTKGYTNLVQAENSKQESERLLELFGANLKISYDQDQDFPEVVDFRKKRKPKTQKAKYRLTLEGNKDLNPQNIDLPRDALLAIFFTALAIFVKRSQIELGKINAESTNFRIVQLLKNMGAEIWIKKTKEGNNLNTAQITALSSDIKGRKINLPELDQVLPMLSVIACLSQEATILRGLKELRNGKTDKLKIVSDNLRKMGAKIGELEDGLVIEGKGNLNGAELDGKGDFSISLGLLLASLLAEEESKISDFEKVLEYYPNIFELLDSVCEYYK
jgi:3-phosphoshikimate 1-carboxyvinyltransferase